MNMDHIFDAEIRYRSDMDPVIPAEGRDGQLIGSGDGELTGKIRGTMRWSFFAADCAYLLVQAGIEPPPGQHLCKTNPGGVIETEDGARIRFDAKGYGLRGYDQAHPHKWRLTMALQFSTDDERYGWLNSTLGLWAGEFNEHTRSARYHAYAVV